MSSRTPSCIVLVFLLLTACDSTPPPEEGLREGKPFPALILTDLQGNTLPLDSYRGKTVILNVWATWCAPCRRELPSLQRLSEHLDVRRYAVIGLSLDDDPYVVREYLNDKKVTFTNYLDRGHEIADGALGVTAYPSTFIIAADGRFLRRHVGEKVWDSPGMRAEIENF